MRAIWKGSISFGLVNIPIALYPATKKEDLRFRLLRESDLSPVNYKRVNPEKYHDDYREALMEVIDEKVESGGKEIRERPKKAPKPTKVIDLVSVLQQSSQTAAARKTSTARGEAKRHKKAA